MAPEADAAERALVEAAREDPARFAELYEAHFERIYAYAARRVRDRHAAEDITSDVFQQALANIGRYEWRGAPFSAWLYRIAANAIADRWRRAAREQGNPSTDEPAEPRKADLEEAERRALLYRLVETLPADQRRVIRLRFAEEKSVREVAQELRRTEGAVKQLQFRALKALRARASKAHG